MNPKKEMIRIVRSKEDGVLVDLSGKKPGKGAYICKNSDCMLKAKKASAISRALDASVPEEVYGDLEKYAK